MSIADLISSLYYLIKIGELLKSIITKKGHWRRAQLNDAKRARRLYAR